MSVSFGLVAKPCFAPSSNMSVSSVVKGSPDKLVISLLGLGFIPSFVSPRSVHITFYSVGFSLSVLLCQVGDL